MIPFFKKNYWISLGLIALFIRLLFVVWPTSYEWFYRDTLFPVIRFLFDNSFGYLPFAAAYFMVPLLLGYFFYLLYKWLKLILIDHHFKKALLSSINFIMGFTFLFLFLWGFHYTRTPIESIIQLPVQDGLTSHELEEEIIQIHQACTILRSKISQNNDQALNDSVYGKNMADTIRYLEKSVLTQIGVPVSGYVATRFIQPSGLLLRFNASGIYLPFTGEAHIEEALPMYVKTFTTAHELAHGFGYGSEASCNFVAYITCMSAKDPTIQYAGQFAYLRYLMAALKRITPTDSYKAFRKKTISKQVNHDLDLLYAIYDRYPGIADQFQRRAYDLYLKSQGIKEGIRSYNRMIILCYAWRKLSRSK